MPYPVSCGDLVRRVRQRTGLETTSGTITFGPQAFPDAEVIDALNVSITDWYDLVLGSTFAGQFARAPWNITTTQGVSVYPNAPNFYRAISVDGYLNGSQTPINVDPYQEPQRNVWAGLLFTGWAYGAAVMYMLQGQNISFRPFPQGSITVTVNYFPTPPVLGDTESTIDSVAGWEEYFVLDAGIKLALKDGQYDLVQLLQGLKEEQKQRILAAAPNRDQGAPERITVTRGIEWSDSDDYGWGL